MDSTPKNAMPLSIKRFQYVGNPLDVISNLFSVPMVVENMDFSLFCILTFGFGQCAFVYQISIKQYLAARVSGKVCKKF